MSTNSTPLLVFAALIATALLIGCVGPQQYASVQDLAAAQAASMDSLRLAAQDNEIERRELAGRVRVMEAAAKSLSADTARQGRALDQCRTSLERIKELNELLTEQNAGQLGQLNDENRALLEDLARQRSDLQSQSDALIAQADALATRSARVAELESLIASRDASASALRQRVADALLGFADRGLTVEQRDGKVYVSLEAKLLFPSGSTTIDPDGQRALEHLAAVIATQDDLEIQVEGHTDTDALVSSTVPRNNWELSVLRATAVVKILTAHPDVDGSSLSATGRSEFHPVDANDKARNRRIEIVLAPNLDELYELIEGE